MMQTLWKTVWQVLKKLNIELTHMIEQFYSLGIYPKELKARTETEYLLSPFMDFPGGLDGSPPAM